jgi:hypothetical protein
MRGRSFTSSIAVSLAVSALAILNTAQPAWAKKHHSKLHTSSGDPCAAPTAYVSDRISRIKALLASAPDEKTSLFNIFGSQNGSDAKRSIEISDLRNDADGVNALLQAGGCKAFDLDRELAPDAK